jgi:hypothetical protein
VFGSFNQVNLKYALDMPIIRQKREVEKMKITKEVIACWIIGAILIFFGTSVENYIFEILAVIVITIGFVLAIFWEDLFKVKESEQKKE